MRAVKSENLKITVWNSTTFSLEVKRLGSISVVRVRFKGGSTAKTIPQQLTQEGQIPVIGKMKELNTPGTVLDGEFKVADYLPDMGNPQANWHQNSGILRSVMNEKVPIKDVSMFPMDNAGF